MNMTEILLKVALNTITLTPVSIETWWNFVTTTHPINLAIFFKSLDYRKFRFMLLKIWFISLFYDYKIQMVI
jgi:hypothetical protein